MVGKDQSNRAAGAIKGRLKDVWQVTCIQPESNVDRFSAQAKSTFRANLIFKESNCVLSWSVFQLANKKTLRFEYRQNFRGEN